GDQRDEDAVEGLVLADDDLSDLALQLGDEKTFLADLSVELLDSARFHDSVKPPMRPSREVIISPGVRAALICRLRLTRLRPLFLRRCAKKVRSVSGARRRAAGPPRSPSSAFRRGRRTPGGACPGSGPRSAGPRF